MWRNARASIDSEPCGGWRREARDRGGDRACCQLGDGRCDVRRRHGSITGGLHLLQRGRDRALERVAIERLGCRLRKELVLQEGVDHRVTRRAHAAEPAVAIEALTRDAEHVVIEQRVARSDVARIHAPIAGRVAIDPRGVRDAANVEDGDRQRHSLERQRRLGHRGVEHRHQRGALASGSHVTPSKVVDDIDASQSTTPIQRAHQRSACGAVSLARYDANSTVPTARHCPAAT